jgi:SOS response regulatory protein OraA/RecX
MPDKTDIHYSRTSERWPRKERTRSAEKPKQSATAYAVWLLSRREYSAALLQEKLLARGYASDEVSATMRFLHENNYQSDTRYAGMKARNTAHRAGDRKIAMLLAQKGIAEDLASAQIAELLPEEERAAQAASAKFAQQVTAEKGISPELAQKIWRHLGYRGFSGKAIKHALNVLKEET